MLVTAGSTAKLAPLLAWPPTVTTMLVEPAERVVGTQTFMDVSFQLWTVAETPSTVTVLLPCTG